MVRDVKKFAKELSDYINKFIAGKENTHIIKCPEPDMQLNRGLAIQVEVDVPENMGEKFSSYSPTFYAEELLNEFPGRSVSFIAEMVNKKTNEVYSYMLEILTAQVKVQDKTLDEFDIKHIIVTAQRADQFGKYPGSVDENSPYITKTIPKFGLVLNIKAAMCLNPANENQTYFTPVHVPEGREVTEEEWETAMMNTLVQADMNAVMMMTDATEYGVEKPIAGELFDLKHFADYFYLLNIEHIWRNIVKCTNAEKLYIIPMNAYHVRFVVYDKEIVDNPAIYDNCHKLIIAAKEETEIDMPIYVLDCKTMEINEAGEDDEYAN